MFRDTILPLLIIAGSAYMIARFFRRRDAQYISPGSDPYAEDWSKVVPPTWNPPLSFGKIKIGQQFVWDDEPNHFIFEKIEMTDAGCNARCDLYDTQLSDTDTVRLVTTPAWNN